MGTDCQILLPSDVQVRDVADIIGACLGQPKTKRPFSSGNGWAADVDGVGVSSFRKDSGLASCAQITVKDKMYVMFHFEASHYSGVPRGAKLLMPRATAQWIAIGKRLVDFFGGDLFWNDCADNDKPDYSVRWKSPSKVSPDGNKPWQDLQERIMAIEPITKAELAEAQTHAAY